MKRVAPIVFEFVFLGNETSEARMDMVYARLFRQGWKSMLDLDSTQKYTKDNYD